MAVGEGVIVVVVVVVVAVMVRALKPFQPVVVVHPPSRCHPGGSGRKAGAPQAAILRCPAC